MKAARAARGAQAALSAPLRGASLLAEPMASAPMVLFVSNLPIGMTDAKLRELYEADGPVERAFVMTAADGQSKHYGAPRPFSRFPAGPFLPPQEPAGPSFVGLVCILSRQGLH